METELQLEDLQINFDPNEILDNTSEPPSPDIVEVVSETEEEYDTTDGNYKLYERLETLRTTIQVLREQLHEERENFQRELQASQEDEFINRTAKLGVDYYRDYERYHDLIIQAHFENRQNVQKQIAVANYKRRLMEVDNMCTLELMKVRQSVQILQPLQVMVNGWKFESEAGDHNKQCDILQPLQLLNHDWKGDSEAGDYCKKGEVDIAARNDDTQREVQMAMEGLARLSDFKGKMEIQFGGSTSDPGLTESETCLLKQSQSDPTLTSENCVNS